MKLSLLSICATVIFLAFSSVISQAYYQGKPVRVQYKCSRGNDDVVEYSADGKTAVLKNSPGANDWVLTAQPVESGFFFVQHIDEPERGVAIRGTSYDSIEIRTGTRRTFKQCVAVK